MLEELRTFEKALNIPVIGPHKEDQFLDGYNRAELVTIWDMRVWEKNIIPDRYLEDGETMTLGGTEFGVSSYARPYSWACCHL